MLRVIQNPEFKVDGFEVCAAEFSAATTQAAEIELPLPQSIEKASAKRRAEYIAGRLCAARAIAQLAPGAPQVVGSSGRAPVFPAGLVGSITHTAGIAVAVVAKASEFAAVGVDSERVMDGETFERVVDLIADVAEWTALQRATGLDDLTLATLIFSAKESIFKCYYPRVGRVFDFKDARLTAVNLATRAFQGEFVADLSPAVALGERFEGRFALAPALVHTLTAIRVP